MNTPDSHRDIMLLSSHELAQRGAVEVAMLENRQLARDVLHPVMVEKESLAVAGVRGDMAMVLNREALQDPVSSAVERVLAVNKLLRLVGKGRMVVGASSLGRTTIERTDNGGLNLTVTNDNITYQFAVDSDGNIEGGSSTPEADAVGGGMMQPGLVVDIVNSLGQLSIAH